MAIKKAEELFKPYEEKMNQIEQEFKARYPQYFSNVSDDDAYLFVKHNYNLNDSKASITFFNQRKINLIMIFYANYADSYAKIKDLNSKEYKEFIKKYFTDVHFLNEYHHFDKGFMHVLFSNYYNHKRITEIGASSIDYTSNNNLIYKKKYFSNDFLYKKNIGVYLTAFKEHIDLLNAGFCYVNPEFKEDWINTSNTIVKMIDEMNELNNKFDFY